MRCPRSGPPDFFCWVCPFRLRVIRGLWQEFPQIQPEADVVSSVAARRATRLDDASVCDLRRGVMGHVDHAPTLQRQVV